ncbi:hypothetical protein L1887_44432 [Cichorium endivia]|nr:hypothetical protein L1887_44432 [Cichorium endivia]
MLLRNFMSLCMYMWQTTTDSSNVFLFTPAWVWKNVAIQDRSSGCFEQLMFLLGKFVNGNLGREINGRKKTVLKKNWVGNATRKRVLHSSPSFSL